MHRISIKDLAVKLRENGYTYTHIAGVTGLPKSTLSGWLAKIPYSPNAQTIETLGKARAAANKRKAQKIRENLLKVELKAANDITRLSERDLFIFGLGLYLGEGSKTNGLVRLVNSDPRVIQAAMAWFGLLGVRKEQFSPIIHLYPDNDIDESLRFWSEATTIPITQFYKSQIDVRTEKKSIRKGKLPHGTLHLGVKSLNRKEFGVNFARQIQAWNDCILLEIQKRD